MNNEAPDIDAAVGASMQPNTAQAARLGYFLAADTKADAYAEAQRVARRTGVPVDTVFAEPSEMKRQAAVGSIDFDTLAQTSPATAALLADMEKAKIAHDDVGNTSAIEATLRPLARFVRSAAAGATFDLSSGFYGLLETGFKVLAPLADPLAGTILPENPLRRVAAGYEMWRKNQAAAAEKVAGDQAEGFVEQSVNSGFRSFGQMLPTMAATVLTGNPAFALGGAGALQGSQSATKALDAGQSPLQALIYGAEDATAEVATEYLPVARLLKDLKAGAPFWKVLGHQIATEVPTELAATAWQNFNEWSNLNDGKPFGAYLRELPAAEAQTVIATITTSVLTAGLGKAVHSVASIDQRRQADAESAPQVAGILAGLNELAKASKILPRDAETFEQFIARATEDGPVPQVFVDAHALLQSGVADQVAAVSPSVAEQLPVAAQTGGLIAIPTSEYAARIAPTEFSAPLLDHLKVDENGYSVAEAQEYLQQHADELRAEVERAVTGAQDDDAFKQSADAVRTNILGQLDATGRFTPQANAAYASLVGNFFAVQAAKIGVTPEELYQRYPLKVGAEKVTGGAVLDQSVWHGTPHIWEPEPGFPHGRPRLDKMGSGEGAQAYGWGWYSAQAADVAQTYQPRDRAFEDKVMARYTTASNTGDYAAAQVFEDFLIHKTPAEVLSSIEDAGFSAAEKRRAMIAYRFAEKLYKNQVAGALYRLDLPDDVMPKLLDWDKPLNKQPPEVRKALAGTIEDIKRANHDGITYPHPEKLSAEGLYGALEREHGGQKAASEYLASLGIPGLRYLDQQSRVTGEGTHNYVIWDQKVLDRAALLERNGEKLDAIRKAGEYAQSALPDQQFADTERQYGGRTAYDDAKAAGKTNLNYRQWVQVRTPAFKEWFGDWEKDPANASKVVDPDTGEPLVVYHGTTASFSKFESLAKTNVYRIDGEEVRRADSWDMGDDGKGAPDSYHYMALGDVAQLGPEEALRQRRADAERASRLHPDTARLLRDLERMQGKNLVVTQEDRPTGDGFYFTPDKSYSFIRDIGGHQGGNVMPLFLSIKNPIRLNASQIESAGASYNAAKYEEAGHDGAVFSDYANDMARRGIGGSPQLVAFHAEQIKSATANTGEFSADNQSILHQQARGSFNPATLSISLLKKADLSTFLHETGHFFLEVQFDLAAQLEKEAAAFGVDTARPGEAQILQDTRTLLDWFGVENLDQWHNLDFEQKRSYHEQFARGFEAYLFEGKSPSIEMRGMFQRFRAWLLHVYRDIKNLGVTLTPEVRGVFDRMVASNEQITLAEQARSMWPLFSSPEQAGMTAEQFAAYQALGTEATADAIDDLQERGLRDMQWLHTARGRIVRQLQRESRARREEVQIDARREVMSQPIYRAWQFLTGKMTPEDQIEALDRRKSDPSVLDESMDSLFVAIAKLGGINKDEAVGAWGIDPADKPASGVFGKPVWRRQGGLSLDAMAERLAQYGYLDLDEQGKWDLRDFEDRFRAELSGNPEYSTAHDYSEDQYKRAGDQVANPQALGAGRLDRGELQAIGLPADVRDALRSRRMTAPAGAGLHPDIVAELFGFTSGDELARELAAVEPMRSAIAALTDVKMLEQFGELSSPEAIEKAADRAIHNDARARFVTTEANALAAALGRPRLLARAAKDFAEEMIARVTVRMLRPGQYASAEVRAAKAAEKASKSGDTATAAAEKRNQALQAYATKAAYAAQEEIERGLRYLKRFDGAVTGLDLGYLEQIRSLLSRYDLRKRTNVSADREASLRAWVVSRLGDAEIPYIAESLLSAQDLAAYRAETSRVGPYGDMGYADDGERARLLATYIDASARTPYKNLTVEQFRGLVDTVKNMEGLGKLKDRLLSADTNERLNDVKQEIADSLVANARKTGQDVPLRDDVVSRVKGAVGRFLASHIRASVRALVMDGGKDNGAMWRYFIAPANAAEERQVAMHSAATEALTGIMAPVLKDVPALDRIRRGKFYPEFQTSLNWANRFAVLLNLGNEGNTQRLLSGGLGGAKNVSLPDVMRLMSEFSEAEVLAAQAVWDHFEHYRPALAQLERETKGREPEWINPRPITIQTRDGKQVTLRGGYYPVVYDPLRTPKVAEDLEAQDADMQRAAARSQTATRQGFLKSRVPEVRERPLLLTLDALYSGLGYVIHDIAFRRYAIDVSRLLKSKRIKDAILEHHGAEDLRQLRSFARDLIVGTENIDQGLNAAASLVRRNVSTAGLALNVLNWLQQPFGIANTVPRLGGGAEGLKWVGKGLLTFAMHPARSVREAMAASDFLRNRARTRYRDLNEIRNRVHVEGPIDKVRPWMLAGMIHMQLIADTISWHAGRVRALAKDPTLGDVQAAAIADQVVRDSQGGGELVDLSLVEQGSPLQKLFTTFANFQITGTNMAHLSMATNRSIGARMTDILAVFTLPVLVGALAQSLAPGDKDEKDEEKLLKLLQDQVKYLFGSLAFVRELSAGAGAMFGKSFGYEGPTGMRLFGDLEKTAVQVRRGEMDDAFRKAAVNLSGDLFGLPSAQANRTITGAKALHEGKTSNPAAVVFGFQEKR